MVTNHREKSSNQSYTPFTATVDGKRVEVTADMAKNDQLSVILSVVENIRQWVHCTASNNHAETQKHKPLRVTVRGSAGSGKSFFIKALSNTVRKMFGDQSVVQVAAPTGAAAFNVGGETLHRKWCINPHRPSTPLGAAAKKRLMETQKRVLVIIVDERSMLTSGVLGASERNVAATCHGGSHDSEDWGGVPVVILVGDDYQLPPPTNKEKGAFDTMDTRTSFSQQKLGEGSFGSQLFLNMSETCMELSTIKRQNGSQEKLKRVLNNLRLGEPNEEDADFLMKLHLANFKSKEAENILNNGTVMHLFATKAPRDEFNCQCLSNQATQTNPAALIKAKWETSRRVKTATVVQHFDDPPESAALICRGAVVRITGKNFEPELGLYNNAVGKVVEIVYKPGENPNNGDHPLYVAVKFQSYSGPPWVKEEPKVVPIPMVTFRCQKGCCKVTFCPLTLSYGMTCHTFQGQSAGPVDKGQPKNAVDKVVVEPGNKKFEGGNPGLLYMAASRATTVGGLPEQLNSALYFTGPNMNRYRVLNLKYQRDGKTEYKKVELRGKWVQRLENNTVKRTWTKEEEADLLQWAETFRMSRECLDGALASKEWRMETD